MPIVSCPRDLLFERLGDIIKTKVQPNVPNKDADKEFDELCFEFGIELDDVTSEKIMFEKEKGLNADASLANDLSDEILYKLDIPANRYDLLCLEGVVQALRVFRERDQPANFHLVEPKKRQVLNVKASTMKVRPVVVAAILRDITFTDSSYKSFIELQEKLHQNICKKRELVSVGTHDLDTVEGPFSYEAISPRDIKFAPLNQTQTMDGVELFAHIDKNDQNLKKYLHIIRDSPVYPVIFDAKKRVLSLPPIINGDHSKIRLTTKNVFIEVTAMDLTKANIVLNTICAMFGGYCKDPFSIEPVDVVAEKPGNGHEGTNNHGAYPDLTPVQFVCDVAYLNKGIGINLPAAEQVKLLRRMSLLASALPDGKSLSVKAPITRSDILHACDVQEDLAIAYGYDNLKRELPPTLTHGGQQPLNKLSDLIRRELSTAGYYEALTLSLCSKEDIFEKLRQPVGPAVHIGNPQTFEFQVARTTMLAGLLKTCHHNQDQPLPLKIFEVSDVVLRDDSTDTGARNERRVCAIYSAKTSGLEYVHGLLDLILQKQRAEWEGATKDSEKVKNPKHKYRVESYSANPSFLPEKCGRVMVSSKVRSAEGTVSWTEWKPVGFMGVIHPEVLHSYKIKTPCSAFEINLEHFV